MCYLKLLENWNTRTLKIKIKNYQKTWVAIPFSSELCQEHNLSYCFLDTEPPTWFQEHNLFRNWNIFSIAKYICTTWFIHPEIERCISAFQLFSRRQYHSCWKIYSRTWSCQVFLSNHTTLNVRIRLQYFTFYEFLWCYCLSLFWWCPRSSLDVLEWMNYSLCMVSNSFFSVVSVLETADNWSTCLRVIMHRIGYSLAHNDSKCQMIYEASILTLFVSDLKICSWRIKGKNMTTDRLHKKGVRLLPFGILMIQWELTSKSVGVCIALFLKECIYFSLYMSHALSHV